MPQTSKAPEDDVHRKLGKEIIRMIHDVRTGAGADVGYARRKFTFPGGAVHIFIANDADLADLFDQAAASRYEVENAVPRSTQN
jgi:hypothetical protein